MSVIWFQWREPTSNLGILAGPIKVVVETMCEFAAVGIAVTHVDRHCMGGLVHDSLPKMSAECRNGSAICRGIWRGYSLNSVCTIEESGAVWLVMRPYYATILSYCFRSAGVFRVCYAGKHAGGKHIMQLWSFLVKEKVHKNLGAAAGIFFFWSSERAQCVDDQGSPWSSLVFPSPSY